MSTHYGSVKKPHTKAGKCAAILKARKGQYVDAGWLAAEIQTAALHSVIDEVRSQLRPGWKLLYRGRRDSTGATVGSYGLFYQGPRAVAVEAPGNASSGAAAAKEDPGPGSAQASGRTSSRKSGQRDLFGGMPGVGL